MSQLELKTDVVSVSANSAAFDSANAFINEVSDSLKTMPAAVLEKVSNNNTKKVADENSSQEQHILPKIDIRESSKWFLANMSRLASLAGVNSDGRLSMKEIDLLTSRAKPLTVDERAHLEFYKKNHHYLSHLTPDYFRTSDTPDAISKKDMKAFDETIKEYDSELAMLKANRPGRYEAVSTLRQNFKWLDQDKNGMVSHEEVKAAIALPYLPERQKIGLKAVDGYFYAITEKEFESQTNNKANYERSISRKEITGFMLESNLPYKESYGRRYGTSRPPVVDEYDLKRLSGLEELRAAH